MVSKKTKPGLCIVFLGCLFFLSACSLTELDSSLSKFFEGIWPTFSNAWFETVHYFEAVAAGFESMLYTMLACLSGLGEGLRNIFQGFFIR